MEDRLKGIGFNKIQDDKYVYHFGIMLDKRKIRLYLDRENYCKIDKKSYTKVPAHNEIIKNWDEWKKQKEDLKLEDFLPIIAPPGLKFDKVDNELILSEEYCSLYQNECFKNYDLSMKYYEKLDINEYNETVDKILKKYKLIDLSNLNECKEKTGIYILLQEKYKQMYIGQTTRDLKERIFRHWSQKPKFDKILFGRADRSVIGIDSFGALDTTRILIYYEENKNKIDKLEEKLVKEVPQKFLNNRIGGGLHFNSIWDMLDATDTVNMRSL